MILEYWIQTHKAYKSIFFVSLHKDLFELGQELRIALENEMSSNGVPLGSIISGLPLVDKPLIAGSLLVPAVDSSAYFPVVKADSSAKSSEIIDLDTVLLE